MLRLDIEREAATYCAKILTTTYSVAVCIRRHLSLSYCCAMQLGVRFVMQSIGRDGTTMIKIMDCT